MEHTLRSSLSLLSDYALQGEWGCLRPLHTADHISYDQSYPGAVLVIHSVRICLVRRARKKEGVRSTQPSFGNGARNKLNLMCEGWKGS